MAGLVTTRSDLWHSQSQSFTFFSGASPSMLPMGCLALVRRRGSRCGFLFLVILPSNLGLPCQPDRGTGRPTPVGGEKGPRQTIVSSVPQPGPRPVPLDRGTAGGMEPRLAVLTGATHGIGLETARGLTAAGWDLVLACRDVPRAAAVRDELQAAQPRRRVEVTPLDLASLASIRACAAALTQAHASLHLLVNNAGVFCDTRQRTADGFEMTMGVNFLGPMLLTRLLLPTLVSTAERDRRARIVMVSSAAAAYGRLRLDAGAFTDGPHGFRGYAASKLALVLFTAALADELAQTGVTVNAVHPGDAATNIWSGQSLLMRLVAPIMRRTLRSPAEAARAVLHAALAPELEQVSGAFLGVDGQRLRSPRYEDARARVAILERARLAVGFG